MIDSSFKFAGIAGAMALAISASVVAQDAEQWRVEDGGNGNWYQETGEGWLWDEARVAAEAVGAHLALITTVNAGPDESVTRVSEIVDEIRECVAAYSFWIDGWMDSGVEARVKQ